MLAAFLSKPFPSMDAPGSVRILLALAAECRNVSGNDCLLLSFRILRAAPFTVIFYDSADQFLAGPVEFGSFSTEVLNNR
jgi:hypothetical protein